MVAGGSVANFLSSLTIRDLESKTFKQQITRWFFTLTFTFDYKFNWPSDYKNQSKLLRIFAEGIKVNSLDVLCNRTSLNII